MLRFPDSSDSQLTMKTILTALIAFCLVAVASAMELSPSTLSQDHAAVREGKFSPWVQVAEEQLQFDTYTAKGLLPIYSERVDGKVRAIYIPKPENCSFWTFAGMDGPTFLKRHEKHRTEGFALLSCTITTSPLGSEYWATWVSEKSLNEAKKELRRLGISQASIK